MINDVEDDPHSRDLLGFLILLMILDLIRPCVTMPTAFSRTCLLGTGSGHSVRALINFFKPYMLTVVVSDWKDFYTSFAEINWANLWNQYCRPTAKKQLFRPVSHRQF